jgi:hypothetical protein
MHPPLATFPPLSQRENGYRFPTKTTIGRSALNLGHTMQRGQSDSMASRFVEKRVHFVFSRQRQRRIRRALLRESGAKPVTAPAASSPPLERPRWRERVLEPISLFTLALVLLAGVQAWAFIQSERAFLVVESFTPFPEEFPPDKPGEPLYFSVDIRNGGHVGASIVESVVAVEMLPIGFRLDEVPTYPPNPFNPFGGEVIAGGKSNMVVNFPLAKGQPVSLEAEGIEALRSGNSRLFVYGRVVYRDALSGLFGNRQLGFCYTFNRRAPEGLALFLDCDAPGYTFSR